MSDTAQISLSSTTRAKIFWRLLPILLACYILNYIDRANIGFAKLKFQTDLGFSEAVYGFGAGLFYLGYILLEVPSNLLLKKIGARLTLMRIMILWGVVSTSFALVNSPLQFYVLRFLLGAAEAGFFPGVLLYLSYWTPASIRARFTGIFMAAMPLAGALGGPISGYILDQMNGVGGLKGWQWLFIVEGAPSVIMAVFLYFWLTDTPAKASWLSDAEKAELAASMPAPAVSAKSSFISLLGEARFWALAITSAALIAGLAGLSLWMPTILRAAGFKSATDIGLLAGAIYLGGLLAQQVNAALSDRAGERRLHAAIPLLIAAAAWFVLPSIQSGGASLAVLAVMTAGMFAATGPFWAMPAPYMGRERAATGVALVTMSGGLAGFGAPIIVGYATDQTGSPAAGQIFYGAVMLLAGLALFFAFRNAGKKTPS